jgi:hypothetical protein
MSTSSSDKPGLGSEIYSGAASFGTVWALIGAIFATVIGTIAIGFGIYLLVRKDNRNAFPATVLYINGPGGPPCQKTQDKPVQYSCKVTIKYSGWADPIDINYTGSEIYYVGEQITIYVKKGDPTDVTLSKSIPNWVGWVCIAGAILVIAFSWFWYWAARRWKFVAAAEGVGGALNIVSGGRW